MFALRIRLGNLGLLVMYPRNLRWPNSSAAAAIAEPLDVALVRSDRARLRREAVAAAQNIDGNPGGDGILIWVGVAKPVTY